MFGLFRKTECETIQELLSEYIDKRLASVQQGRVEAHLRECQACRAELQALQSTVGLLHRVSLVPVPRSFTLTVVQPERRPVALNALRAATAFAALALAVLLFGDLFSLYGGSAAVRKEAVPASAPSLAEMSDRELSPAEKISGAPEEERGGTLEETQTPKYAAGVPTPVTDVSQPASAQTPEVAAIETPPQRDAVVRVFGLSPWGSKRIVGPLRQIHVVLLGTVVILGGATAFVGWRQRRGTEGRQRKEV